MMLGLSTTAEAGLTAMKIIYLGGCFLPFFILYCILDHCKIVVNRWVTLALFLLCIIDFVSILTTDRFGLFYKDYSLEVISGDPVFYRTHGPMHTFFYVVTFLFILLGLIAMVYSWVRKKQVPRTIVVLLSIPYLTCALSWILIKILKPQLEILPVGYVLAQIVYIIIARRALLYDVAETVVDSMVQEESVGFISFDFKYRYLGSNSVARKLIPSLENLAVDGEFGRDESEKTIIGYLERFKNDPSDNAFVYAADDKFFDATINYLYNSRSICGFIITFKDATESRKYMQLLDKYNEELQSEVNEKTKHIVEMHDNLIMSLAMMVESRDNSTGGHIKRTSEGVRILVDEIKKEGTTVLSDEFCTNMIKAAPMHDLGKIAVDDSVLRKPGKFTDSEYEEMKKHSAEGAKVIHEILLNTDNDLFKLIAENVAHYHHERWDGSGYPEGKKGAEIPLEARIMAIADVYDALVSKRVYKEAFDFDKADRIIIEGMGTQFDPGLKSAYEKARERLEDYYGRNRD
jgi:putative two-component system response regulator